jgi:hypothetical protein
MVLLSDPAFPAISAVFYEAVRRCAFFVKDPTVLLTKKTVVYIITLVFFGV